MDRDASSDEEDDTHNLVDHNDRKHHSTYRRNSSRSFELESSSLNRHSLLSLAQKRRILLFLAILLPVLFLLLFFSADIKTFFSNLNSTPLKSSAPVPDPLLGRMRDAELHALSLLQQQRLSLVSLIVSNRTAWNDADFKSAIANQVSANRLIQDALLSPHGSVNSSSGDELSADFNVCEAIGVPSERRAMKWNPPSGKYLLAICLSGQISNHLICLEKHMFFAAAMGRTLVLPSPHLDYVYSRFLDIDHINECLGNGKEKFVISFDEFSQTKKGRPHLDRFYCYFAKPNPCYIDDEHVKKMKGTGLSVPSKLETPLGDEDVKKPGNMTVDQVKEKFGSVGEDVVAVGDLFFANVEEDWISQPGGALEHKCRSLIEPSKLIKITAQRFVQTFLGKNFIALHFRRHGWLKFCNAKTPSCFYSIPEAASCIRHVASKTSAPVMFLSTDAADSETSLLQALLKEPALVKRPAPNAAEKWDALLYRHHIEGDPQVEAMLDKTICAMAAVFIGSPGSTFTQDILRIRKDWGTASSCDEYLCRGTPPQFVAENE